MPWMTRPEHPFRPPAVARLRAALWLGAAALAAAAPAQGYDYAFERELYKARFGHEVQFRAAAIHVAWGAEQLCDQTTQIEPFVLLSVQALRQRLSDEQRKVFSQVTGMDEQWRVVWVDEAAPEALRLGSVVRSVNGRELPGSSGTKFQIGALFRGGSVLANDDQAFWDVMLKARTEAEQGRPMTLTLADGSSHEVETQTGCAGSVTASSFDADPDAFWRQGTLRAKIPANAMLEASTRDEFRWLAAFGTYFQASQSAIEKAQQAEGMSNGFVVGKILTMTLPGMGMLLSAVEAQAEKTLVVDSIVGNADLFANEVVASLGGDAAAGLRLNERMAAKAMKVEAVLMSDFRRSTAAEHARRIKAIQAAQLAQEREQERREALAQEEARRLPLNITPALR
jgi:hypothetical protein